MLLVDAIALLLEITAISIETTTLFVAAIVLIFNAIVPLVKNKLTKLNKARETTENWSTADKIS